MENRQRTIRKLLWRITAVLAVLAVVSICFVSGTFARYVTKKSGSTTTEVAKWDIDVSTDGILTESTFALVNKLSPSMAPFPTPTTPEGGGQATVTNREKSSGTVLVLKIENKGDVDAELVITPPKDLTFYGYDTDGSHAETGDKTWGTGFAIGEDGITAPTQEEAREVITMQFALVPKNTDVADITWYSLGQEGSNLGTPLTLKAAKQEGETQTEGTSVYCFYVRSKWTSRDQHYYDTYKGDLKTAAAMSDGLDTWLGENIAKLGGEFTFSVVQASELPGTNP